MGMERMERVEGKGNRQTERQRGTTYLLELGSTL